MYKYNQEPINPAIGTLANAVLAMLWAFGIKEEANTDIRQLAPMQAFCRILRSIGNRNLKDRRLQVIENAKIENPAITEKALDELAIGVKRYRDAEILRRLSSNYNGENVHLSDRERSRLLSALKQSVGFDGHVRPDDFDETFSLLASACVEKMLTVTIEEVTTEANIVDVETEANKKAKGAKA